MRLCKQQKGHFHGRSAGGSGVEKLDAVAIATLAVALICLNNRHHQHATGSIALRLARPPDASRIGWRRSPVLRHPPSRHRLRRSRPLPARSHRPLQARSRAAIRRLVDQVPLASSFLSAGPDIVEDRFCPSTFHITFSSHGPVTSPSRCVLCTIYTGYPNYPSIPHG